MLKRLHRAVPALFALAVTPFLGCGGDETTDTTTTLATTTAEPQVALSLLPVSRLPVANGLDEYTVKLHAITSTREGAESATFTLTTSRGAFVYRGQAKTKLIERFGKDGRFSVALRSCNSGPVEVRVYATIESKVKQASDTGQFGSGSCQ